MRSSIFWLWLVNCNIEPPNNLISDISLEITSKIMKITELTVFKDLSIRFSSMKSLLFLIGTVGSYRTKDVDDRHTMFLPSTSCLSMANPKCLVFLWNICFIKYNNCNQGRCSYSVYEWGFRQSAGWQTVKYTVFEWPNRTFEDSADDFLQTVISSSMN